MFHDALVSFAERRAIFMKKFMTAVTAVSLSAMMLAGCGKADVQQRGFAGAGCADNCNKFALLYT